MNPKLTADLRWFLDHADSPELPGDRLHTRAIWSDEQGNGSKLGTKMTSPVFARWLELGETSVQVEHVNEPCQHTSRGSDGLCDGCVIIEIVETEDGPVAARMGEAGFIPRTVERYRWPMRAAMAKARRVPVRHGRPDFGRTLAAILRSGGDLADAQRMLARTFPVMGSDKIAEGHFTEALIRARRYFTEQPPIRREKSEAQLDAEHSAA